MAELLAELPRPERKPRYPWHEWMDGRPRRLRAGRDFFSTVRGMRSTVQTHAKTADVAVAVVTERDPRNPLGAERSLCIQFFPHRTYREGPVSP